MATQNHCRKEGDGIVLYNDLCGIGSSVRFSIDQDRNLRIRFIAYNGECDHIEEETTFVIGFSDAVRILATLKGIIDGFRYASGSNGNEEASFRVDHTTNGSYLFEFSCPNGPRQIEFSYIDGFGLAVALEGAMPYIAFGI